MTQTSWSPAAALACSSALSMPSVTYLYTAPGGFLAGTSCVTTNTGRRAAPLGPSAPHHGSEWP